MVVLAWVVLGVVLLAVETHHLALYLLFVAVGAFAAAGVAAVAPDAIALQVLVAVVASTIGIVGFRPMLRRQMQHHRGRDGLVLPGVHGAIIGQEVVTLDEVGPTHRPGHVRLAGERWLAISGSDAPIPAGVRVLVTAVQGTTLTVWPVETIELDEGMGGRS